MVRLGCRERWVSSVCAGRLYGGTTLDRALRVVRDDIVRAMFLARKKKQKSERKAATSGADCCMRNLGISTSDEDEEPEMEENPADSSVTISGLYETEYGGKSFKVAKVGKQVYIEGRAEVLQVVCDACLSLRPRSQLTQTPHN